MNYIKCSISSCACNAHRDANGRNGMCSMHYQRVKKHGDPDVVKSTPSPAIDWLVNMSSHTGGDCVLWPFHVGKDGYGRVHEPKTGKLLTASRMMCIIAHGKPPTALHEAAHRCGKGNQGCTNPNHLYWATPSENQSDRVAHGTSNRGSRQWKSKLTDSDVREIRNRLNTESQASIAAAYGIDQSTVSNIKHKKKWSWLD